MGMEMSSTVSFGRSVAQLLVDQILGCVIFGFGAKLIASFLPIIS